MAIREDKAVDRPAFMGGGAAGAGMPRPTSRTEGAAPLPVRDLRTLGGRIRRLASLAAACHEARVISSERATAHPEDRAADDAQSAPTRRESRGDCA
ncbi:MAG: hypothetical protein K2X32_03705 [Phycisphaerales bacterium]|nr:hypothetical protein [Phycisphaerales bacterium]